jgi:cleavage and polyadenylation specificity factor subunit 1
MFSIVHCVSTVVSICSTPLRTREGRVHHTLVLGTSAVEGEDTSARGRLILLDVYKASIMQDENGVEKRVTQLRAQTALSRKEKGPVTALCMIDNTKTGERMMATAVGSRVILYRWVGDKLEGCAFIDTQLYVSSLRSLRDYLVVGDFAKSVALCVYEPELKQIYMLGKDSTGSRGGASVHAVEFLADRDELSVVSSDQGKNLLVFNYSDLNRTLTVRADYHIGSRVNSLLQLRARTAPKHPSEIPESLEGDESVSSGTGAATGSASSRAKALQLANLRHFQLATDLDGGIHRLIPLDDAIFRRLFSLQTQLTLTLEHSAGLNPRAHRLVRVESQLPARLHLPTPPKRNIVDIDLVWRYLSLDVTQQRRLARTIGTQPETIVENLLEFEMAMRLF